MKKFLSLLPLCFVFLFSGGQTVQIDSLKNALASARADTARIQILNELAGEMLVYNPLEAKHYFDEVFGMYAVKPELPKQLLGQTHLLQSHYHERSGNYTKALESSFISLKIAEETRSFMLMANSMNNIGYLYFLQGNYQKAEQFYLKAIQSVPVTEKNFTARSYHSLGIIYREQGYYEKALASIKKSAVISLSTGNKKQTAASFSSLGNIFSTIHQSDSAIYFLHLAEKIYKELNDKRGIAVACRHLADEETSAGQFLKAQEHYYVALKLHEELGDKMSMCLTHLAAGKMYAAHYKKLKQEKHFTSGNDQLMQGLKIAQSIGALDKKSEFYEALSALFELKGDYKTAYQYLKMHMQARDSMQNEDNFKRMAELQAKYEFDKKEYEIILLKKEMKLKELELERMRLEMLLESETKKKKKKK
jgi:tetratricopeptide (TPR) repeat protein